jgi:GTPase
MSDQAPETPDAPSHRTGFVALVGRPNVGKSTLLNRVLGIRVAAVSDKPQTTRNRIVGIHSVEGLQAILIDTPGLHDAKSRLNKALVDTARSALGGVDAVCWIVDAEAAIKRIRGKRPIVHKGHEVIAKLIAEGGELPLIIALNKVDCFPRDQVLPLMAAFHERWPQATLIPISARKGENVDALVEAWRAMLPEGPPLYPEDQFTESSESFLVTEFVREKIFRSTYQEIPYATAVEVERFEERPPEGDRRGVVVIHARIVVEQAGQKGVIIGKGGQMLQRIGSAARKDIENLLGTRVHLDIHVAVERNWTENPRLLHELGIE